MYIGTIEILEILTTNTHKIKLIASLTRNLLIVHTYVLPNSSKTNLHCVCIYLGIDVKWYYKKIT
jgi:hypothetical protein